MKISRVARVQEKDACQRQPELIQAPQKIKAIKPQGPKALKLCKSLSGSLTSGGVSQRNDEGWRCSFRQRANH